MANATCLIDACGRPARVRKMCKAHYARWRKENPDAIRPYPPGIPKPKNLTVEERFWPKVDSSDPLGCWPWVASIDVQSGYGRFRMNGVTDHAHRVSYALSVGPLHPELVVDHVCRNRACVNPLHLEQVTQRENMRRAA